MLNPLCQSRKQWMCLSGPTAALVAILLTDMGGINAQPATVPQKTGGRAPEILALVFCGGTPEDQVSITYSRFASAEEAQRDVTELARRGVWQTNGMAVTANPAKDETSVSFQSPSVVVSESGVPPLSPFIETWRRYDYLRIIFVVPKSFSPKIAWSKYSDEYLDIEFDRVGSTLTFDVFLREHDFDRVTIPLEGESNPAAQRKFGRHRGELLLLVALVLAVASAGIVAIATVVILSRRQRRQREEPSRRRNG